MMDRIRFTREASFGALLILCGVTGLVSGAPTWLMWFLGFGAGLMLGIWLADCVLSEAP